MSDAWLAFLVVFAMLLAIWRIADGRERPMTKSEQERMFFRQTYSLSIDRMLSESRWIGTRYGACVTPGEATGVREPSGTYKNGTPFLGILPPSSSTACERGWRWIENCVLRPGRTFPPHDC